MWMAPGKLVSRAGAESRWQEGVFLGIFPRARGGAADYAIGTPEGVVAARAIKLKPEGDEWDIELLLAVRADAGPSAGAGTASAGGSASGA